MFQVGSIFDDSYQILEILGQGGMGIVYKAKHLDLNRTIALKVLHNIHLADDDSIARFRREAKALSRLQHENIVCFYNFGISNAQLPFMVLEYLRGQSLGFVLASLDALPVERSLKIMRQVCKALSYAHSSGFYHRDLKPQNVILVNAPEVDTVKIVDFGLAKLTPRSGILTSKLTKTGLTMGTPHYMSPEQFLGMPVDARADVYSCGCMLFEMIAGRKPFEADTAMGLMYKHSNQDVSSFASTRHGKDCPESVEFICRKAMEKDPARRYQSADEMAADIVAVLTGTGKLIANSRLPLKPLLNYQSAIDAMGLSSEKEPKSTSGNRFWLYLSGIVLVICFDLFLPRLSMLIVGLDFFVLFFGLVLFIFIVLLDTNMKAGSTYSVLSAYRRKLFQVLVFSLIVIVPQLFFAVWFDRQERMRAVSAYRDETMKMEREHSMRAVKRLQYVEEEARQALIERKKMAEAREQRRLALKKQEEEEEARSWKILQAECKKPSQQMLREQKVLLAKIATFSKELKAKIDSGELTRNDFGHCTQIMIGDCKYVEIETWRKASTSVLGFSSIESRAAGVSSGYIPEVLTIQEKESVKVFVNEGPISIRCNSPNATVSVKGLRGSAFSLHLMGTMLLAGSVDEADILGREESFLDMRKLKVKTNLNLEMYGASKALVGPVGNLIVAVDGGTVLYQGKPTVSNMPPGTGLVGPLLEQK